MWPWNWVSRKVFAVPMFGNMECRFTTSFCKSSNLSVKIGGIWGYIRQIWPWNAVLQQVFADLWICTQNWKNLLIHSSNLTLECGFTTGFCRFSNVRTKLEEFDNTFINFDLGMLFYDRFLQSQCLGTWFAIEFRRNLVPNPSRADLQSLTRCLEDLWTCWPVALRICALVDLRTWRTWGALKCLETLSHSRVPQRGRRILAYSYTLIRLYSYTLILL